MSKRARRTRSKTDTHWGPRMILIVMAMLTVSMAFFSGLYIQAGLPFFPSLIGGFAIFIALFGSLPRQKTHDDRDEIRARFVVFEDEIVALSRQLEQFQTLSGKIGQIDDLNPTLQQLEGFLSEMKSKGLSLSKREDSEAHLQAELRLGAFSKQLKELDQRMAYLNDEVAGRQSHQQAQLQTQIENLDQMVQDMAQQEKPSRASSKAPAEEYAPCPGDILQTRTPQTVDRVREEIDNCQNIESKTRADQNVESAPNQLFSIVTKAIKQRQIDIYLQPVVSLPQRKTVYYEVFTRLRDEHNNLIMPDQFVPVAEEAGLMPLIDNMMLVRAIKIIRQMDRHTSAKGLFCSLSTQSLVDPDFFPKLIDFLKNNRDLAGRIIFEISQAQKKTAGPIERDGIHQLAQLGFHFSLDKVIDMDLDFDEIARMNFKYVRISADRLVNGMAELGARIHGADKAHYLQRFGIHLIVERIETERQLSTLADYNIRLGQGYLFAEPRPIRPGMLEERAA